LPRPPLAADPLCRRADSTVRIAGRIQPKTHDCSLGLESDPSREPVLSDCGADPNDGSIAGSKRLPSAPCSDEVMDPNSRGGVEDPCRQGRFEGESDLTDPPPLTPRRRIPAPSVLVPLYPLSD